MGKIVERILGRRERGEIDFKAGLGYCNEIFY